MVGFLDTRPVFKGHVLVVPRDHIPTLTEVPDELLAPLLAAAFLFAAFTALCAGLLRIFSRRGFSTAGSVSRTLDMPVLAVAPAKAH